MKTPDNNSREQFAQLAHPDNWEGHILGQTGPEHSQKGPVPYLSGGQVVRDLKSRAATLVSHFPLQTYALGEEFDVSAHTPGDVFLYNFESLGAHEYSAAPALDFANAEARRPSIQLGTHLEPHNGNRVAFRSDGLAYLRGSFWGVIAETSRGNVMMSVSTSDVSRDEQLKVRVKGAPLHLTPQQFIVGQVFGKAVPRPHTKGTSAHRYTRVDTLEKIGESGHPESKKSRGWLPSILGRLAAEQ